MSSSFTKQTGRVVPSWSKVSPTPGTAFTSLGAGNILSGYGYGDYGSNPYGYETTVTVSYTTNWTSVITK